MVPSLKKEKETQALVWTSLRSETQLVGISICISPVHAK